MTIAAGGRHALPRRGARLSPVRRMVTAALAAGAATALAVVASGGTYALLSSGAATAGGTLRAGTATLTLGSAMSLPTTGLQPGSTITGATTVTNSGDVPLLLRVAGLTGPTTATGFSSALSVGVSVVPTTDSCPAVSTGWTGTFATATPSDTTVRLGVGDVRKVCVSVTLPLAAPAASNTGGSIPFTLTLDGRQVA